MYSFFIKNYKLDGYQNNETEIYSVPLENPEDEMQFVEPGGKTEIGKAGSFEFSVYPNHPYYDVWRKMMTIVRVEYDGDTIFRGRVITIDNNRSTGERKIHAEGDLAFLLDSQQEGVKDDDRPKISALTYLRQVIDTHNSQMGDENDKKFTLGEVPGQYSEAILDDQKVKTEDRNFGASSWQSSLSALENMQKSFGGFFRTRYQNGICYLDWLDNYFDANEDGQEIEVAQNLIEVSDTSEVEGIFTELIPVGSRNGKVLYLDNKIITVPSIIEHFTDEELNAGFHTKADYQNAISDHGHILKVEQFSNADTKESLLQYALDFILHNYNPRKDSYTTRAVDMHHIYGDVNKLLIGYKVIAKYPDPSASATLGHFGIERKNLTVVDISWHPHNPENNEYTIGIPESLMSKEYGTVNKKSTLSSYNATTPKKEEIKEDIDINTRATVYDQWAWMWVSEGLSSNWKSVNNGGSYYQAMLADGAASETYHAHQIAHTLVTNYLTSGSSFGGCEVGPFMIGSVNNGTSHTISITIRPGITRTQTLMNTATAIINYLRAVCGPLPAYILAHPEVTGGDLPTILSAIIGKDNGTGSIQSIVKTLLPEGVGLTSTGDGYDISNASDVFTDLLEDMGISTGSGNVLSLENMQKFLGESSGLSSLVGNDGKFSLESLTNSFPELKNKVTEITSGNWSLTEAGTQWLIQKVPVLQYVLGDGETTLSLDTIKELIENVPIATTSTNLSLTGNITLADPIGDGATVMLGNDGSLALRKKFDEQWNVKINEPLVFDTPITYTDSAGVTHTVTTVGEDGKHYIEKGAIQAVDLSLPDTPSFSAKIAQINTLFAKTIFTDNLVSEALSAGIITTNTLQAEMAELGVVWASELFVDGSGSFANYIQAEHGFYTSGQVAAGLVSATDVVVNGTLTIGRASEGHGESSTGALRWRNVNYYIKRHYLGSIIDNDLEFYALSTSDGGAVNLGHAHSVSMTEVTTGNNAGKVQAVIGLAVSYDANDSSNRESFFDIAASTTYQDGVLAAWDSAEALVEPPVVSPSDLTSSFVFKAPDKYTSPSNEIVREQKTYSFTISKGSTPSSNGYAAVAMNGNAVGRIEIGDWYTSGWDSAEALVGLPSASISNLTSGCSFNVPAKISSGNGYTRTQRTLAYTLVLDQAPSDSGYVYLENDDRQPVAKLSVGNWYTSGYNAGWSQANEYVDLMRYDGTYGYLSITGASYEYVLQPGDSLTVYARYKTSSNGAYGFKSRTIKAADAVAISDTVVTFRNNVIAYDSETEKYMQAADAQVRYANGTTSSTLDVYGGIDVSAAVAYGKTLGTTTNTSTPSNIDLSNFTWADSNSSWSTSGSVRLGTLSSLISSHKNDRGYIYFDASLTNAGGTPKRYYISIG